MGFLTQLVSDPRGVPSTMRIMLLINTLGACVGYAVILWCLVEVVRVKGEFPAGFWQALAGLGGLTSSGFAAKAWQSKSELKSMTAPPVAKEPD